MKEIWPKTYANAATPDGFKGSPAYLEETKVNLRAAESSQIEDRCIRRKQEVSTVLGRETQVDVILLLNHHSSDFKRLMADIDRTNVTYHMIFVNDAIQNETLKSELELYLKEHPDAKLVNNEQKIGQVSSINRGLIMSRNALTVLLGSDVALPPNWLERLIMPLMKDPTVASVTPFSNHGMVAGFPTPFIRNRLFENYTVEEIDKVFQEVRSLYTTIPYGLGFCMALSRSVVHKIGVLDQHNFTSIHGADIEWSLRAVRAGYRNVIAENLYVSHHHETDDLLEGERMLSVQQEKILTKKVPQFAMITDAYRRRDPLSEVRAYAFVRLVRNFSTIRRLIYHQQGDNRADNYMYLYMRSHLSEGEAVIMVSYDEEKGRYLFDVRFAEYYAHIMMDDIDEIGSLASRIQVNRFVLGRMMGAKDIPYTMEKLSQTALDSGARLVTMLLDSTSICPRGDLLCKDQERCPVTGKECTECFSQDPRAILHGFTTTENWRERLEAVLKNSREILYYSPTIMEAVGKVFQGLEQVHKMDRPRISAAPLKREVKATNHIRLLIPGKLTKATGLDTLQRIIKDSEHHKLPFRFYVRGEVEGKLKGRQLSILPDRGEATLPQFILQHDIDAALIPDLVPDPIGSFVNLMAEMRIPIIASEGAGVRDILSRYEDSLVLSDIDAEDDVFEIEDFLKEHLPPGVDRARSVLFLTNHKDKAKDASQITAMREWFSKKGVHSICMPLEKLKLRKVGIYNYLLIDSLDPSRKMNQILEEADRFESEVFYLARGNEYSPKLLKERREIMEKCSGIIAVGKALGALIRREIPGASVTVIPELPTEVTRWIAREVSAEEKKIDQFHAATGSIRIGWLKDRAHGRSESQRFCEKWMQEIETWMDADDRIRLIISEDLPVTGAGRKYRRRMIPVKDDTRERIFRILSQTDILIVPAPDETDSQYEVSTVIYYAQLMEVPIIIGACPMASEAVKDGVNGIVVRSQSEWKDAVAKLSSDPKLRRDMGKKASERIESAEAEFEGLQKLVKVFAGEDEEK